MKTLRIAWDEDGGHAVKNVHREHVSVKTIHREELSVNIRIIVAASMLAVTLPVAAAPERHRDTHVYHDPYYRERVRKDREYREENKERRAKSDDNVARWRDNVDRAERRAERDREDDDN